MAQPVTQLGESRVRNYSSEDLLQAILQELRAIRFVLCKMDGTIDPGDFDPSSFSDAGTPSGPQGS